jgi:hypothetical protein
VLIGHLLSTAALAFTAQAAQPGRQAVQPPAPAAATSPSVGATVFGAGGERIGTIASLTADAAVIDNGTNQAAVPLNAFAADANGFKITLTKAQFDTAAAQAAAQSQGQLKAALVAGAQVKAVDGATVIGTVKAVEGELVTLNTTKGDIRVPVKGFAVGANGLVSGLTPAQIEAAAGTAQPPASK